MKQLFVFAFCLVAVTAINAQNNNLNLQINKDAAFRQQIMKGLKQRLNDSALFLSQAIAVKKPGVYRLPQDGMPCIVPDTKDITAIPNTYKGIISVPFTGNTPRIPKPTIQTFRYQIKPSITPNKK